MTKKVGIFTTNSVDKIHPRIALQEQILKANGYEVDVIRARSRKEGFIFEVRNILSLKYFKWGFIYNHKKDLTKYDIVHIYDFCLLPLAKHAKKENKKVLYETLDDNVHLHFHALKQKISFIRICQRYTIRRMANYERKAAEEYCDQVIVNSSNLLLNFNKANLIYYTSPLEGIKNHRFDSEKETAFLYLGKLTKGKGADIYRDLVEKYQIKLCFLGKAFDDSAQKLMNIQQVEYLGDFDSVSLKNELKGLLPKYNFIGLSIIIPENKSYLLQEANKDIDYLAMGVPFIGNDRPPTSEKINKGAGVLFSEMEEVSKLMLNKNGVYDLASQACENIYKSYRFETFKEKLLSVYTGFI